MRKIFAIVIILVMLSACNSTVINTQATREANEALGTIFPTDAPRATLAFPTRQPTPAPTRGIEEFTPTEIEVDGYSVSFIPSTCELELDISQKVECGDLILPENRGNPAGPSVSLPVVILRSSNYQVVTEPVIFLAGGGGYDVIGPIDHYIEKTSVILRDHDYIFYNQRGAPKTQPSLFCDGYSEFLQEIYGRDVSSTDFDQAHVEFLLGCYQSLLDAGHDLSTYNSATNAADLNDLRRVLGYEQINIYGSSYGTKLGLTAMREYPEMIRSAILDSVYPPESDLYVEYPENAKRAFDIVFEECAADPPCADKYPSLEADFYEAIDQLNAEPVPLDFSYGPYVLNGDRFLFNMTNYFYGSAEIKNIPWAINLTHRQNYGEIISFLRQSWYTDFLSWGMFFSMQCNEEVSFSSREEMAAANARVPEQLTGFFGSPWRFDLCDSWQSGLANTLENQAVTSDVPTLIFAGHYDLETPATWGEALTDKFSNSYFFEFPNTGHGVTRANDCALEIMLDFLADPSQSPDSDCFGDQESISFR